MSPGSFEPHIIIGELALNGHIRPVKGVLSIALAARKWGVKSLLVPVDNAQAAAIVRDIEVRAVKNLLEVVKYLNGEINIEPKIGRAHV